jgi:hypothetical protein
MLKRFGDVFYWIGNFFAALVVLAEVAIVVYHQDEVAVAIVGGVITLTGLIPYLTGRACRYVLAGRF